MERLSPHPRRFSRRATSFKGDLGLSSSTADKRMASTLWNSTSWLFFAAGRELVDLACDACDGMERLSPFNAILAQGYIIQRRPWTLLINCGQADGLNMEFDKLVVLLPLTASSSAWPATPAMEWSDFLPPMRFSLKATSFKGNLGLSLIDKGP